jgi:O-methyltransferase
LDFKIINNLPGAPPLPDKWCIISNNILRKLRSPYLLSPRLDGRIHMNSMEQRISMFHLANEVLNENIEGEWVEFGCYTGQAAIIFQAILDFNKANKLLHVYDNFQAKFGLNKDIKQVLIDNFTSAKISIPKIVEGYFEKTIPAFLPEKIAFASVDCGTGSDKIELRDRVLFLLNNFYHRMQPGGMMLFIDYHDSQKTIGGFDINPGVKMACDIFFKDKPEEVYALYGNQYSLGYTRKLK